MTYDKNVTAKKGATEGGVAGIIATILAGLILANNPTFVDSVPGGEAAVIGGGTAILSGIFKAFRNWKKNRNN